MASLFHRGPSFSPAASAQQQAFAPKKAVKAEVNRNVYRDLLPLGPFRSYPCCWLMRSIRVCSRSELGCNIWRLLVTASLFASYLSVVHKGSAPSGLLTLSIASCA